jgi:hypothetical protein
VLVRRDGMWLRPLMGPFSVPGRMWSIDGTVIDRGKLKCSKKMSWVPFFTTNRTWTVLGANPGEKPKELTHRCKVHSRKASLIWFRYNVYLESFEMWCWRRLETISWTDRVKHEGVKQSQGRKEHPTYNKERLTGLFTSCVGTAV